MQYSWVKIFHFDDSYLHVFHNLMYVNKIIWLKPLWNCCKREVSASVTVEHTTFDMHVCLIASVLVATVLPYSLKLALTEGYFSTYVTSSFMCYHRSKIC